MIKKEIFFKKNILKYFLFFSSILCTIFLFQNCGDSNKRIFEQNASVPNRSWTYDNMLSFEAEIVDTSLQYNIYLNLRHGNNYLFRNLWVIVHTTFPSGKRIQKRVDLPLADKSGKWYGKGVGDIRRTTIKIQPNAIMPEKGLYKFEIEQNMRKNPLKDILDIGLGIEVAHQY